MKVKMVFMLLLLVLLGLKTIAAQSIGVCYGQVANNLPQAKEVIDLCKTNNIGKMRIFDVSSASHETLEALKDSKIELVIGVSNVDIQPIANDVSLAANWVQNYILMYSQNVNFKYIVVGNEIDPYDPRSQFVLRAMQNIYTSLASANLQNQIKISTALDMRILGSTYPPSTGAFSPHSISYITPIVNFLVSNGAPILANVYPYYAYIGNKQDIPLDYALFKQQGNNDIGYQNLFDAQLDSLYAALEKVGGSNVKIIVSESGWPSAGDDSSTTDIAATYYTNLISHVNSGNGTPMRPGEAIETYLFGLFDENLKPGSVTEQNFGLFKPDKSPKYQLGFL